MLSSQPGPTIACPGFVRRCAIWVWVAASRPELGGGAGGTPAGGGAAAPALAGQLGAAAGGAAGGAGGVSPGGVGAVRRRRPPGPGLWHRRGTVLCVRFLG